MQNESIEARLGDLQLRCYNLVRLAGWAGKTVDEIEVETGLVHQSVSARINELETLKLIERRAAKRPTRSGRKAFIFVAYGLRRANGDT